MKTVGIIAEYNPFHNGHKYHIEKAKEITGADYCIVVMSGSFVQRGAPAIINKYMRTKAALMCGADLVIELPIHYSTASAEYFASGAVAILDKLGVTDSLCFGSECGNIQILSEISDILLSESKEFKNTLKQSLKAGNTYPKARNDALCAVAPHMTRHLDILSSPNNILGLEYLKALKRRSSKIEPCTISRIGTGYHDIDLNNSYSSALAIRESIMLKRNIRFIKSLIPECAYEIMEENYLKTFPVFPEDISYILRYKLIQEQETGFNQYFDIDSDFSDRLTKHIWDLMNHDSLCEALKSKNMTYTRVSRNLLHILLNIYQSDMSDYCSEDYIYYARMLGFKKDAAPLLSAVKSASTIPLISKLADADSVITSENGIKMLSCDIRASHIYSLIVQNKFNQSYHNEYTEPIIIA